MVFVPVAGEENQTQDKGGIGTSKSSSDSSIGRVERWALALSYLINNLFEARSLDECLDVAVRALSRLDFFQSQISLFENGSLVVKRNYMDKRHQFLLEKMIGREFIGHRIDANTFLVSHLLKSRVVSTIDIKDGERVKLEDAIRDYLPEASRRLSLVQSVLSVIPKKLNLLIVPLNYRGRVIGAVGFSDANVQHADSLFLTNFCDILAQAFELVKLNETLTKYRNIFEKASDAMILLDKSGTILDVNQKAIEVFGGQREEVLGRHFREFDVLSPTDIPKLTKLFAAGLAGKEVTVSLLIKNKAGQEIFLECLGSLMKTDGDVVGSVLIARDVTDRRKQEDETKRRLMKFSVEDGSLYLVRESVPTLSLEAFKDLLKIGYHGLAISRTTKQVFCRALEGDYRFLWLAERGKEESVPPRFEEIELVLEGLPRRSAVYLDRVDYLISKHGFREMLLFVQRLREYAYLTDSIFILPIDPATLSDRELRLLEKETREIEPTSSMSLSDGMLEVLGFVYRKNILGVKPNHSAISRKMKISRPTVTKRIRHLVATGYLIDAVRGRSKVLELTQRGRDVFLREYPTS